MLFKSEEKNMLVGAFTAGIVDTALESYFSYRSGQGYDFGAHPEDPAHYLYYRLNEWLPPNDDLIALVGVPVLLWGLGKNRKSAKLRQMGIGAMVYGFSEIIGSFALKLTRVAAGQPLSYRVISYGGNRR